MREILSQIMKPSHYAGLEDGIILKDPKKVQLHLALAFPDLYEVGMSYLGQKIIYGLINARPEWLAERVMAPEKETGLLLQKKGLPLTTLETDTPLKDLDCVGFSITHELCYTNVLYMLDLAQIPLKNKDRNPDLSKCPLIVAGGGALLGAEPLAPFMDLMLLGDGEEAFPLVLDLLVKAKAKNWTREEFLSSAQYIAGVYVPSFFELKDGELKATSLAKVKPTRTIVADLNKTDYPTKQVVPVGAVHNRLSIEIARGCTRGCRFCQAGIVYRPVRERSVETIEDLLSKCLKNTGFEEISFMSLSTGDYSALKALSHKTLDLCHKQQISLSLPSQRVGSIDDEIFAKMSDVRRTGMTLAPEAGSQRLRDVINKGITEADLLLHAQKLIEHGWRLVKLYFMIGLPTETDDDLLAIVDLCKKVRDAAGRGNPRLQVTAAISPFVPKPFTPFQWVEQISQEEIVRRVYFIRDAFKGQKCLQMRWHEPAVSHLEGILSRAGREMARVVEKAYQKGAIFCSWMEHFTLEPWMEALKECNLEAKDYIRARGLEETLPWDHLEAGVSKEFLRREYAKANSCEITPDCRYHNCNGCGCCDLGKLSSRLHIKQDEKDTQGNLITYQNRLVLKERDQKANSPNFDENGKLILQNQESKAPQINPKLTQTIRQYRIWHTKVGMAAFLSQLELQSVIERALRRGDVPVAFSRGFHPLPLLSFGRAIPVGVESYAEWFAISLCEPLTSLQLRDKLGPYLPKGLEILKIQAVDNKTRTSQAREEVFEIRVDFSGKEMSEAEIEEIRDKVVLAFENFSKQSEFQYTFQTKKGERTKNLRPLLKGFKRKYNQNDSILEFRANWEEGYISPLKLVRAILGFQDGDKGEMGVKVVKVKQKF